MMSAGRVQSASVPKFSRDLRSGDLEHLRHLLALVPIYHSAQRMLHGPLQVVYRRRAKEAYSTRIPGFFSGKLFSPLVECSSPKFTNSSNGVTAESAYTL